jgi:phytanoyl-CoA hydroxylase
LPVHHTTPTAPKDTSSSSASNKNFFHHAGFLHLPHFCSISECETMKSEMKDIVLNEWMVEEEDLDRPVDSFGTDDAQNSQRGDYFLESANAVHFFAEPCALNANDGTLMEQYRSLSHHKVSALNKVGHGLHLRQGSAFDSYTFSPKVKNLVTSLGWDHPVVPQSMYIFKGRHTGGVVSSHQDSTFLFTEPKQTCLGLWLALDDATLDNGCLWVRPKSHWEPVRRHFQRNPDHFGNDGIANRSNECHGDLSLPKFRMVPLSNNQNKEGTGQDRVVVVAPWEGSIPDDLWSAGFIPIECQAGDLLAFCGETDHLSLANHSDLSRHTFQLHLIDDSSSSSWSPYNWLQYPPGKSFVAL